MIINKKIIQFDTWKCSKCGNKEVIETMLANYPDGTGSPNQKTNLKEVPIWRPQPPSGWVDIRGEILCCTCYFELRKWINN
jgi:hypothetical protein